MNADRKRAFDNYASKLTAAEIDSNIKDVLSRLEEHHEMSSQCRTLWLEDLGGWVEHYRMAVMSER